MQHGIALTVVYDGTHFAGFAQQTAQRTVQGVLAEAAERVCRHPVTVRGASRTDSGVHALGQVVAFATTRELTPQRWLLALNRYLPDDVSIAAAETCDPEYNPRFDARDKLYRYVFHMASTRNALRRAYTWHLGRLVPRRRGTLDLEAMRRVCAHLQGTHDFRAFRAAADLRENTTRTLLRVELIESFQGDADLLALEVHGSSFMLNMVRIIAGTLVDVGRGHLAPEAVLALLGETGDRRGAGQTAPAHGLTLVAITLGRLSEPASR